MTDGATLLKEYNAGQQRTPRLTYATLGARYGLTIGQVASKIRAARKTDSPKVVDFPTPLIRDERPLDYDQWQDTLRAFKKQRWITVGHDNDNHFGDHDQQAINMRYRLYARKQPDLTVVGSDAADYPTISHFDTDPEREVEDVLDDFASYWIPHIDNLNAINPHTKKVFMLGNHDYRVYALMDGDGRRVRRTIEARWLEIVRYGGVMWLGREQELEIGPLLVKHGDRASEHAAKAMLEQEAYQVHIMAGHIHRTTSYTREGRRYQVTGITSGCAQNLRPHYVKAKGLQTPRRWNHGLAFATVDMDSMYVDFDNIRFAQINGRMVANCDGEILELAA